LTRFGGFYFLVKNISFAISSLAVRAIYFIAGKKMLGRNYLPGFSENIFTDSTTAYRLAASDSKK